ncbi:hypothetical protein [Streptomyces sp. NPDC055134]
MQTQHDLPQRIGPLGQAQPPQVFGRMPWQLGAAMAVAGGDFGARTALRRGAGFVRIALLCTAVVLVAQPAIDHWA